MMRLYVLRDGLPCEVASCYDDALAFALRTLVDEGQIGPTDIVGVMDKPDPDGPGTWLVNPYN